MSTETTEAQVQPWSYYVDTLGVTKTEAKMVVLMLDGLPHGRADFMASWGKKAASQNLVGQHIYRLKPKLQRHGYRIETDHAGNYTLIPPRSTGA